MGVPRGRFELKYDTDTVADKIEVFDGRKKDIAGKKPLWEYYGATRSDDEPQHYKSQMIDFNSPIITIRVTGTTVVNIIVKCPEQKI